MGNAATSFVLAAVSGTTPSYYLGLPIFVAPKSDAAILGSFVSLNHDIGAAAAIAVLPSHFFFDFYNRIYTSPVTLQFGAISSDSTITVEVWNAFLAPNTLTSTVVVNAEGIVLAGPTTPRAFAALEVVRYTVSAFIEGPPLINSTVEFNFTNGSATLGVQGTRALIWSFPINWAEGVTDSREFRTEILTTRSGKEQRRALRSTPRRRLEFTSNVVGESLRRMIRLMERWKNFTVLMPDWVTFAKTASPLLEGASTVTLEVLPSWITVGEKVILLDANRVETRTVESVDGLAVTFTFAGGSWAPGVKLYRALPGLLGAEITANLLTTNIASVPVTFEIEPATLAGETFPPPSEILDGVEVFTRKPNWADPVTSQFTYPVSQIDYGRGRIETFRPVDFGTTTRRATFLNMSTDDVQNILGSFSRAKGRRGELYASTGLSDLVLKTALGSGVVAMRVEGREIYDFFNEDTVHRAIAIRLTNGTTYYRSIDVFELVSDSLGVDTIVRLNEGLPVPIEPRDVLSLSWLPRQRFGSDSLTLNWITDTVAEVTLSFTSLENLAGT